ncbi:MAG: VWA domain-containing protein, partial [Proteobacteria bacterium]|nr:VWA domain-containing protein [Pseudomonadota bacterium]
KHFKAIGKIKKFQRSVNYEQGVTFLLLIDNSGSMYRTMEGDKTTDGSKTRISLAKKAIGDFLSSMKNPRDRVGLAAYNKLYHSLSAPLQDRDKIRNELDQIDKDIGDPEYTEIYGSINLAISDLKSFKGRKAILILSDGENRPSYPHSGKLHPDFKDQIVTFQSPLKLLQFEGISLFAINFGKRGEKQDLNLNKIARLSGGTSFDAHSTSKLNKIYLTIMDQVLNEYVLSYAATMESTENKITKVDLKQNGKIVGASRLYFAGTVFGRPTKSLNIWMLMGFVVSLVIFYLLTKLRFERKTTAPMIEVLDQGAGAVLTKVVQLDQAVTIIGSAADAALTIVGVPTVADEHATIIFDESRDQYKLSGSKGLQVNNKTVTSKVLEPGDLINMDGVTMVFDR